jgi:hypothetical protein
MSSSLLILICVQFFIESAVETHRSRLHRGESDQEIHSLPQPAIFSEGMFRRYAARRS